MKARKNKQAQHQGRLDLETWLERALEALAARGPQILTVEKLCHELGVSRGSFYWHFENRAEFVRRLADYWHERFTLAIRDAITSASGGPAEQLMFLIEAIQYSEMNRFDLPVRAWANTEPLAAKIVRKVDEARYRFVRSLFEKLGFSGDELEMRTRTFVVYYSMEDAVTLKESPTAKKRRRKLRHRLLTSK